MAIPQTDAPQTDTPDTTAPAPKTKAAKVPSPSLGGGVHFVLDGEAVSFGTHRPAVILGFEGDSVDLIAFTSTNDGDRYARGQAERHNVPHDEDTKAPGTWHWPE